MSTISKMYVKNPKHVICIGFENITKQMKQVENIWIKIAIVFIQNIEITNSNTCIPKTGSLFSIYILFEGIHIIDRINKILLKYLKISIGQEFRPFFLPS